MEDALLEMYVALPSMSRYSLYIRGYTEALSCVDGVKVVPSPDFIEDLPFHFRRMFEPIQFPCYYVPIKLGGTHYGFILKGEGKETSRFSTYYPFFNLDALKSDKPYVFVVEGIKDAGIFLTRGHPAMGMLTSGMSEAFAGIFGEFGKVPIFVPDNDEAGAKGMKQMRYHLAKYRIPFFVVAPKFHKDMGNYFDRPDLAESVEATYVRALAVAEAISSPKLIGRK